jgi:hypothetical protein
MSYTLSLQCGCTVYVACHPQTRIAHTRVIQERGGACRMRMHAVGVRLFLWEMLPDPAHRPRPAWVDSLDDTPRSA